MLRFVIVFYRPFGLLLWGQQEIDIFIAGCHNLTVKKKVGYAALGFLPLTTIWLWLTNRPLSTRFGDYQSVAYSLGQISGLVGVTLFALVLFLNTRAKILEEAFDGLNKVFPIHHNLGKITFFLILVHPGSFVLYYLLQGISRVVDFIFGFKSLAFWAGPVALGILTVIIIITLWVRIPYHIWRFIHQFIGVAFAAAAYHFIILGSDMAGGGWLRSHMLLMVGIGIGSYFYRTVLGLILVRKYQYLVENISWLNKQTLELVLKPKGVRIKFEPGQFVFIKLATQGLIEEQHPFSIISAPDENNLRLAIKILGDFTGKLPDTPIETPVKIEGPYGKFCQRSSKKRQIWIAGGIGVSPMIGMMSAISPKKKIDFYYSVPHKSEAIYLDKIRQQVSNVFKFKLWESEKEGRLTARNISKLSKNIKECLIYMCGPIPMMEDLKSQFEELGVARDSIKSEEFKLVP